MTSTGRGVDPERAGTAGGTGDRATPERRTAVSARLTRALIWLGAVLALGLLQFCYHHLGVLADGGREPFARPLINEMTGAVVGGILFFPTLALVRRLPLTRGRWGRRLPVYLGFFLLFGPAATTMMWGSRLLLYPLAGLGHFDYGVMPLRYLMELPMQAIAFSVMVGAIHAVDAFRAAREREVRAAMLSSHLARAQLKGLRLQLQPHFLFNALNTVSSTMYTDPAAADEILDRLAELLRASLRTAQEDEVSLTTELEVLEHYLAIMSARFGDRLRIRKDVDPDCLQALVPSMILQPLVENAVRHGGVTHAGSGSIEVRARRDVEALVLEVENDGAGVAAVAAESGRSGFGLEATAERLRLLYGDAQRFTAGRGGSGFLVRVTLPFHAVRETTP